MCLQVFLEQKKMLKTGLNIAHFKDHVKIIEAETIEYFQRWGDSGEKSEILSNNLDHNTDITNLTSDITHFQVLTERTLFQTCLRPCPS